MNQKYHGFGCETYDIIAKYRDRHKSVSHCANLQEFAVGHTHSDYPRSDGATYLNRYLKEVDPTY